MGVKTWFSRGEHQPLLEDTNMPRPTMIIRDPEQEARVQEWITAVIREWPENQEYADALKNGVILCKFMNTICPGSIKKINTQGGVQADGEHRSSSDGNVGIRRGRSRHFPDERSFREEGPGGSDQYHICIGQSGWTPP